jgi:hypothetical protein
VIGNQRTALPATASTTAATAAATGTAAIATAAAARTTTATRARLVLRFIHAQRATAHRITIQALNGTGGISLAHLHEAEAAWPTGLAIGWERHRFDRTVL